ncbi:MAG TPA: hypothetical protein ENN09_05345, partial [Planctomycetes bacterium]|nr:hypothetical protein [Planctomycetota bacterium]
MKAPCAAAVVLFLSAWGSAHAAVARGGSAADAARERLEVARRAAADGLFDFAEQEASILAVQADFPYTD